LFSAFLAFALQLSQAQLVLHGPPASATSPTADGQLHGVPASVVSPTSRFSGAQVRRPVFRSRGPLRRFGSPRARRPVVVPLPVFYPIYTDGGDYPYPSEADPYVSSQADPAATSADTDRSEDALREAYIQGARDAAARQEQNRYGEHYLDSRENARSRPAASEKKQPRRDDESNSAAAPTPKEEDHAPATVFIFKDGHQIETRNFAIMGKSLFDFSSKTLKKIQLDEIDSVATLKANDDRGITVKLP
jgi:hypothetical protein